MLITRDESVSRISGTMLKSSRMRPIRSALSGMSAGWSSTTTGFGRLSQAPASFSSCSAVRTAA